MSHVEPAVVLAVELQDPFDVGKRRAPRRRAAGSPIEQPVITLPLIPLPPASKTPRMHPQNLRRPKPMNFPADRFQHHFLQLHRPLPRGPRISHGVAPLHAGPGSARPTKAAKSLALGSGQIMYSLQTAEPLLAPPSLSRYPLGHMTARRFTSIVFLLMCIAVASVA